MPLIIILISAVWSLVLAMQPEGLPRYRALTAEVREVEHRNEELRGEILDLERRVEALRHDPQAIEQVARDRLGLVKPNEVVFQFPE